MNFHSRSESLEPFFNPRSVAIIGASRTEGKGGYNIVENLQRLGYPGAVYPINPAGGELLGLPVYKDITMTPDVPDLALIVIQPSGVRDALAACIDRRVRGVIIETAGFGELGSSGAALEHEFARMAREGGIRLMGPNSVGTIDTFSRLDTSLGRLNKLFYPCGELHQGKAGFIGQTGLFTGVFLPLLNEEIGFSKIAALGNKCEVDECDMLEYYSRDDNISFVGMYLESVKDGRRFMSIARDAVRRKPVVVIKSAVTEAGARMSASHTGSIAGEDRVYDAAFRQTGIIRVGGFEQLWDMARAFVLAPLPHGNRVAIINLAGSGCVTAVDACIRHGLRVAGLSPKTLNRCRDVFPSWWKVGSPIDLWTAIETSGFAAAYTTITRAVLEDDGVDAAIVIGGAVDWLPGTEIPSLFAPIVQEHPEKPVLVVNPPGDRTIYQRLLRGFREIGVPCFSSDEAAVTCLAAMCRYRLTKSRLNK